MDADREKRITEAAKEYHKAKVSFEAVRAEPRHPEPEKDEDRTVREAKCLAQVNEAKAKVDRECGTPPAPQTYPAPAPILTAVHESLWVKYRDVFWVIVVIVVAALVGVSKHV